MTEMRGAEPRRMPLSKDLVFRVALELADAGGLSTLSMRRLGRELGVEAMSLYYHAANKDEILNGIVDLVLEEIEPPTAAADWRSAIRAAAISAHAALGRHPWACTLLLRPASLRPRRIAFMDAMLARLREAGFPPSIVERAYHTLDGHIFGTALWQLRIASASAEDEDLAGRVLRDLGPTRYPDLVDHIRSHLAPPPPDGGPGTFEFGLDLILDGLARLAPADAAEG